MSKISKVFEEGKAFIGFLTGGDPSVEMSVEFILEMERGGADLIEIGIPFSDPVAEGSVIQQANIRALSAGATTDKIFDLATAVRQKSDIPLVFLTYLNPVFRYGYSRFFEQCHVIGVDGIIIPDLPFEEKEELADEAEKYGVDLISLIAPTSEQRIRQIAGTAKAETGIPVAVGFGINTPEQAREIGSLADGVIVGSAIVKIIEKHGEAAGQYLYEYVKGMKVAIEG